ncbi:MAG: energy transducer TonB [Halothiobacillus sp.]
MTPSRIGLLISVGLHGTVVGLFLFLWLKSETVPAPKPAESIPLTLAMFAPASEPAPQPEARPETRPDSVPAPMSEPTPSPPVPATEPPPVNPIRPKTEPASTSHPNPVKPQPIKPKPARPKPLAHAEHKQTIEPPIQPASQPSPTPESQVTATPRRAPPAMTPAVAAAPTPPLPEHNAAQQRDQLATYQAALAAAIEREKFYPPLARRLNQEGIVDVGFTVQADGRIVNIHVLGQAPSAALARGAIEAIERVGKFKPIPPELGKTPMNLTISLVYKLR